MTTRDDLRALSAITRERARQDAKWGEQNHPDGTGALTTPMRDIAAFDWAVHLAAGATGATDLAATRGDLTYWKILREEVFEAAAEEPGTDALVTELVQVAAVATAWLGAISRRRGDDFAWRVYLSGPIAGKADARRAFEDAELALAGERDDLEVVNPFDVPPISHPGQPCPDGYSPGEDVAGHASSACYLRADLLALLACDELHLLPGWENSRGASVEHAVAAACGMPITYAADANRVVDHLGARRLPVVEKRSGGWRRWLTGLACASPALVGIAVLLVMLVEG